MINMQGSYVLILKLKKNSEIKVGALGKIKFKKGFYCYIGSALGKGGIEKRIGRYERLNEKKKGRIKWHIDYLLINPNVSIYSILLFPSKRKIECRISKIFEKKADQSVRKFGSSDCRCNSHLHYFSSEKNLIELLNSKQLYTYHL